MISEEKYTQITQTFMLAAQKAGKEILRIYNDDQFDVQLKGDNSPLTQADTASHKVIKQILSEVFPTIPLLSEEGKHIPYEVRKKWKTYICVDPLDGTKEFIKRNGEFTINIALIQDRRTVIGVIYIPCKDVLYFGGTGMGSYKIDTFSKLHSKFNSLSSARKQFVPLPCADSGRVFTVVGSRSHMNDETRQFIDELRAKHNKINVVSAGSSLKFCLVAEGLADVYPRFAPTMEWDTAAAQAIVEGSGGIVFDCAQVEALRYNKPQMENPFFIAYSMKCKGSMI